MIDIMKILSSPRNLLFIIFPALVSCNMAPGSYPYAEKYEISKTEDVLVSAILDFQKDNPQYMVPANSKLQNGRDGEMDHWYHIYFYYPDKNQIIYTWTRPSGKEKTTFAFVSINNGLTLRNWKDINKDYSSSENKAHIKEFEERILNKIKERL